MQRDTIVKILFNFKVPKKTRRDTQKTWKPFFSNSEHQIYGTSLIESKNPKGDQWSSKNAFPNIRAKQKKAKGVLFDQMKKKRNRTVPNKTSFFPKSLRKLSSVPQDKIITKDVIFKTLLKLFLWKFFSISRIMPKTITGPLCSLKRFVSAKNWKRASIEKNSKKSHSVEKPQMGDPLVFPLLLQAEKTWFSAGLEST